MAGTGGTADQRFQLQRSAFGVSRPGEYPNMWACYVLELRPGEDGVPTYYVGHTSCLGKRIQDHFLGNEYSCDWVRRFGCLRVLDTIKTTEDSALLLEAALTSMYKALYGWANCRGCQDNRADDLSLGIPRFWRAPAEGIVGAARSVEPPETSG